MYTRIINHEGNATMVLKISTIYKDYNEGTVTKQQAVNFLHDWGIVSSKELKKVNSK